jgi:hypothetical protein
MTGYRVTKPEMVFQRRVTETCPHCRTSLSLMNYIGGLTLVCENRACPGRGQTGGFFFQRVVREDR